jgi:CubicO group peptidase (beta-lactamase class C family)
MRLLVNKFAIPVRIISLIVLVGIVAAGCGRPTSNIHYPAGTFDARLEDVRLQYSLPALGAALIMGEEIQDVGVVGLRKLGDETAVTDNDRFHIGSCTKSMTATLAALLVQEGVIDWDTTVMDVFPEFADQIHPQLRGLTLETLLIQRSGLLPLTSPNDDKDLWDRLVKPEGTPEEERVWLAREILSREPLTAPGAEYAYSNTNYIIAGTMLEQVTGKPWFELLTEYIFEPLDIHSAGTGAPASPGNVDQPWGHLTMLGFRIPIEAGPQADNPAVLGPAGTIHLSMEDFARYVSLHLDTLMGRPTMLTRESAEKLYTAQSDSGYAMGWINRDEPRAGGRVVWHDGSNSMFYALMVLAPELDKAVVVVTNAGDARAEEALTDVVEGLLQR